MFCIGFSEIRGVNFQSASEPPIPLIACPKPSIVLAKVGKLLFLGTSIDTVVPVYYRETVLRFSVIFAEGLIFSPLITYMYTIILR